MLLGQRAVVGSFEKGPDDFPTQATFTFSAEQRQAVMAAMRSFTGEYATDNPESPLSWYYGQSHSLGLIQAARMIGQERPILDIVKNREIYDSLVKNGFQLVKDNATRAIVDRILPEMQAFAIAGANPLSVAARLQKMFGDQNSNWRRLARTEMSMAAEDAKLAEWTAWEVKWVEFTPAPDGCPLCMALAGDYPIAKCPVAGRDTHPHCRCSTRPAKREVESGSGPEVAAPAALPLARRLEVNDIDHGLHNLMQAYDKESPGILERGFTGVIEVSEPYFMATDCHGLFKISNLTFRDGFNPAADIKSGMAKIKAGLPMSFHEEYSVESLWHEVCHNRARQYRIQAGAGSSEKRVCMEALNQLVARHTYPDFLATLGGKAAHSDKVLTNGYGYGNWVRNLRQLIGRLGIDEKAIIPDMERILYDMSYDRVSSNLATALAGTSGKDRAAIVRVLRKLPEELAETFEDILKREIP